MSIIFQSKKSNQPERRGLPRWKLDKEVIYRVSHQPNEKTARTIDLSCRGACILSSEPLLPTQRIDLSIIIDKLNVARMSGHVAWIRHFPQKNEAGICFDDIDEDTQHMILEHAFNCRKEDVVNYWFSGWDGPTQK